jgi:membrane-bound hydrogenase subunit mbhJ
MKLVGSVRHADVLLVTGIVTHKTKPRVLEVYQQATKPIVVVAIGACPCTGGIFTSGYNFAGPLDKVIPVDLYIPGCPPKPEAMLAGIVKLLEKI